MNLKIIFFSWDNIFSKLIQLKSGSKWSHIGIAFENVDSYIVYEAINKGLVKSSYSKDFINAKVDEGIIAIKDVKVIESKRQCIDTCDKYEGAPYDFLSIFNIGFYYLFGKYALNFKGAKSLICSEFVARVLYEVSDNYIDFTKEYNKDYDYIEPADIYRSKQLR